MKPSFYRVILTLAIIIVGVLWLDAQCPMCRMSAESNLQDGGTEGKGLNTGILYMLSFPYLLISVLAFLWYKNRKQEILDQPSN